MISAFHITFILVALGRSTTGRSFEARNGINKSSTAALIFVGDMSFDGAIKYFAEEQKTCSYQALFKKVKHLLVDADLRIGNLESPLLKPPFRIEPEFDGKLKNHFASIKSVVGLKSAGFDVVQIANNHLVDYGTSGVKSTLDTLRKAGIDYVGLRERSRKQQKPLVKIINGIRIGFLAYCLNKEGCEIFENDIDDKSSSYLLDLGPSAFAKNTAKQDIRDMKKRADIVVVLMHWSRELSLIPPLGIRDIARLLSIFGANLIIGTHPHVIQV